MTNNKQQTTNNKQTHFFQFEADFVNSLHCIPMQVRMKLDTCGVKLKLLHWNKFTQQQRQVLVEMPCTTAEEISAYEQYLQQIVVAHTGTPAAKLTIDPHPPWLDARMMPSSVEAKAQELGVSITSSQWEALTPAQRFALIKLSRPSHENKNFLPALKEFGVVRMGNGE
ncbi:MAG: nitrate reductase maturation protein NarM [Symploca sp. SIO2E6]|nr:nitrate reductase maturation protein NarM [Symploca sp. SIO2E6]